MGTAPLNPTQNKFGAGTIYMAPVGSAVPALTAAAGKFNFSWASPWVAVGGTTAGLTLTRTPTASDFFVAESYYPQHILMTADDIAGAFAMDQVNKSNLAFAWNAASTSTLTGSGGSWATSGASGAKVSQFTPPIIGTEVRSMLGWQGQDDDEVLFIYQVLNVATLSEVANKAPNPQELLMQLRAELPATNPDTNCGALSTAVVPYRSYYAGTNFD